MDHVSSCIALPFFIEDAEISLEPTEIENKILFFYISLPPRISVPFLQLGP